MFKINIQYINTMRNVYVLRNLEGSSTNCIDKASVYYCEQIAIKVSKLNITKIICKTPNQFRDKHIRPIQTAANICSALGLSLQLVSDAFQLGDEDENILIIWNNDDINNILLRYNMYGTFQWDDSNYDGLLTINQNGWEFDSNYLEHNTKWLNKFFDCCLFI